MLDKVGYIILLFLYTFGFTIGKSFFYKSDISSKLEPQNMSIHAFLDRASYRLMDTIGMDDFLRELTDGL